jgi:drug/metabolite transporter (DMT)-like permease
VVGTVRALLWAQIVGGLGLAAVAVLATMVAPDGQRPEAFSGATAGWLAVAGVSSLLAYLCMFYAFEHGRLSVAVPIMSGWAVISSAVSVFVFHEALRPPQVAGAALVIVGVALVSRYAQRESRATGGDPRWVLASLGAALGFGLLIPAISRLVPVTGRLGAVCTTYAADIALGLPVAVAFRVRLGPPSGRAWMPVALAGLFETVGFACIALAAGRAPLAVISPLSSLASPMTVVYAWVVLRDRPPRLALVGAVLASAGVVVLAL